MSCAGNMWKLRASPGCEHQELMFEVDIPGMASCRGNIIATNRNGIYPFRHNWLCYVYVSWGPLRGRGVRIRIFLGYDLALHLTDNIRSLQVKGFSRKEKDEEHSITWTVSIALLHSIYTTKLSSPAYDYFHLLYVEESTLKIKARCKLQPAMRLFWIPSNELVSCSTLLT